MKNLPEKRQFTNNDYEMARKRYKFPVYVSDQKGNIVPYKKFNAIDIGVNMKSLPEQRPAEMKSVFEGKKLTLKSKREGVQTKYGAQIVYTVTVGDLEDLHDFFGGKGLDQQELTVGDVFTLQTMDTGQGNPMYYGVSWDDYTKKQKEQGNKNKKTPPTRSQPKEEETEKEE